MVMWIIKVEIERVPNTWDDARSSATIGQVMIYANDYAEAIEKANALAPNLIPDNEPEGTVRR